MTCRRAEFDARRPDHSQEQSSPKAVGAPGSPVGVLHRRSAGHGLTRREFLLASATAATGIFLGGSGCGRLRRRQLNLILVVSDTLRADHLGCYGFPRPVTPHMDAFARRGVRFENMMSCAPITGASHASLMTGAYQTRHGVFGNGGRIAEDLVTLAQACREADYTTAAFVSNPALAPDWLIGIDRGFKTYDARLPSMERNRPTPYRDAADTSAAVIEWLKAAEDRPFFLWAHFQEPHGPYEVPDASLQDRIGRLPRPEGEPSSLPVLPGNAGPGGIPRYQMLGEERSPVVYRSRYAARASYVDAHIGKVLAAVRDQELEKDTLVVLISDHGELLGEHDYWFQHGATVLQAGLHVPLIIVGPGIDAGRRIPSLVGGTDLMPTLLELLRLDAAGAADQREGHSLVPLIEGGGRQEPAPRYAISEGGLEWCVARGRYKYTAAISGSASTPPLVDLQADPAETRDISGAEPDVIAELSDALTHFRENASVAALVEPARHPTMTEEQRRRLKALGYVK